ncbi:MAG TPA: hypothetical protein ENG51_04785 [Deltaproteobacteria bacterium]|nr:hypothetical protein [Deltaproteobacteria bacterium]
MMMRYFKLFFIPIVPPAPLLANAEESFNLGKVVATVEKEAVRIMASVTMKNIFIILYVGACAMYTLAFSLHFTKQRTLERFAAAIGLALNGAVLVAIVLISGHLPVFNLFESLVSAAFILACLGLFFTKVERSLPDVAMWVWIEILLLLVISLLFPKVLASSCYDFNYPYRICFFAFRVGALSIILFSSAFIIQSRVEGKNPLSGANRFYQGRNFLLLGTILFLVSEYSGMVWCQNGWGDMWRWSDGHLQSVFIFLYLMLAFHIQERRKGPRGIRSLVAGMSGFVMLAFTVIRWLD